MKKRREDTIMEPTFPWKLTRESVLRKGKQNRKRDSEDRKKGKHGESNLHWDPKERMEEMGRSMKKEDTDAVSGGGEEQKEVGGIT